MNSFPYVRLFLLLFVFHIIISNAHGKSKCGCKKEKVYAKKNAKKEEDTCPISEAKISEEVLKLLQKVGNVSESSTPTFNAELLAALGSLGQQLELLQNFSGGIGNNAAFGKAIQKALAPDPSSGSLTNWGGNFNYSTTNIVYPKTIKKVQQIVQNAKNVHVLGSTHSFSRIGDSTVELMSLEYLNAVLGIETNETRPYVKVQSGITYTDLCPYLHSKGYALENLASLSEITVAGAIQTGVHGSGVNFGALASQVRSLRMVLANGTLVEFGPNDARFKAVVVGLGVFGVIVEIDLYLVPTFNVIVYPYVFLPLRQLYAHFDELQRIGYKCDLLCTYAIPTLLWNTWSGFLITVRADDITTVNSLNNQLTLFESIHSPFQVSPRFDKGLNYFVPQNVKLPWYEGLVGTRFNQTGVTGQEIQTEYFVPYSNGTQAIQAMVTLTPILIPYAYLFHVRTIKASDFWLSEVYSGPDGPDLYVSLHWTWRLSSKNALPFILPIIESALAKFNPRPHWAKAFTIPPANYLRLYPKLKEFKQLAEEFDPTHKFRNAFIDANVFA